MKAGSSGSFLFKSMKDRRAGGTASDMKAEGRCQKGTPSSRLPHMHLKQGRQPGLEDRARCGNVVLQELKALFGIQAA